MRRRNPDEIGNKFANFSCPCVELSEVDFIINFPDPLCQRGEGVVKRRARAKVLRVSRTADLSN